MKRNLRLILITSLIFISAACFTGCGGLDFGDNHTPLICVEFKCDCGDCSVDYLNGSYIQYVDEAKDIILPVYARTGYYQDGWRTVDNDRIDLKNIFSDTVIYPVWVAKQYVATFHLNGGKINDLSEYDGIKTVTYDKVVGKLPVPQKGNDYFIGWFYGEQRIMDTHAWKLDVGDVTLVARYRPQGTEYTVRFDIGEGASVENAVQLTQTVKNPSEICVPNVNREGWVFVDWAIRFADGSLKRFMTESDIQSFVWDDGTVIVAMWREPYYVVSFSLECTVWGIPAYSKTVNGEVLEDIEINIGDSIGDKLVEFEPVEYKRYYVVSWVIKGVKPSKKITKDTILTEEMAQYLIDGKLVIEARLGAKWTPSA